MNVKHPLESKTLIVNTVAMAIALYQYYVAPIASADPQIFALTVAAINFGLRFVTKTPVAL